LTWQEVLAGSLLEFYWVLKNKAETTDTNKGGYMGMIVTIYDDRTDWEGLPEAI